MMRRRKREVGNQTIMLFLLLLLLMIMKMKKMMKKMTLKIKKHLVNTDQYQRLQHAS